MATVYRTLGPGQDTVNLPPYYNYHYGGFPAPSDVYDITGFTPGAGGDILLVSGTVLGNRAQWAFQSGATYVEQQGPDAVVGIQDYNGALHEVVFLRGVDAAALTESNFAASGGPTPNYSYYDPQAASIRGGPAAEVLVGGDLNEHIWGAAGNDSLFGNVGNDTLKGEAGDDLLVDDAGSDGLQGGDGNDTLWGGAGTDFLLGGAGNDELHSQTGADYLEGGAGADRFILGLPEQGEWIADLNPGEGDRLVIDAGFAFSASTANGVTAATFRYAGAYNGVVAGVVGTGVDASNLATFIDLNDLGTNDTTFGSNGAGGETHFTGSGDDVLVDDYGADAMFAGAGNDTLWAGHDADFLFGEAGNDQLHGQAGGDYMAGGSGADRFYVEGNDWIADLNTAEGDRVVLAQGTTYSLQQYSGFVAASLSDGSVIGLQGATVAGLGDWVAYA